MALCVLITVSCQSQRKQLRHEAKCYKWGVCKQAKDSTVIIESVRIDTVVTDNSEFYSNILFNCDSLGNVYIRQIDSLNTENANVRLQLKDNKMIVYVQKPAQAKPCPPATTRIEYREKVVEKTTNILTGWQNFLRWSGLIMWGWVLLIIIYIVLRAIK